MRFKTLDTVVKYICEVGGRDFNHKNYGVVLKVCVNTLSDLNLFTQIPNYKTVKLVVNKNLTARMPEDTLRPLKIGKLIDGRISEIRYAQEIVLNNLDEIVCDEPKEKETVRRQVCWFEDKEVEVPGTPATLTLEFINLPQNFDLFNGFLYGSDSGFFWRNSISEPVYSATSQLPIRGTLAENAQEFVDWFNWNVANYPTTDPSGATLSASCVGAEITIVTNTGTTFFNGNSQTGFRLTDQYLWFGETDETYSLSGGTDNNIIIEKVQVCEMRDVEVECKAPAKKQTNQVDRNYTPYENFGYMPVNAGLSGIYAAFLGYNELRGGKAYYEVYGQRPYPALNGYFNYDLVKGIIKFEMGHTEPDDEYLFMYRTEMQEVDGSKVVPVETENMLLYRCKELIFAKSSIEEQRNRGTYEIEYSRIKRLYNKMTLEEWEAAIGGYKFSSIKR